MINILITGKYSDSVDRIRKLASEKPDDLTIVGVAQDEKSAMESIDKLNPDVVVITMDAGDSELTQIAQKIYIYKPRIITVVYGDVEKSLYRTLIDAGVRYAGNYPATSSDFADSLKRLIMMEKERAGYMKQQHTALLTSCMTIGFYSPKSGVGTTTCAINLAAALAKDGKKVILIDLDLAFGDVAAGLDIQSDKTIADLCAELTGDSAPITDIENCAQIHVSGVRVIAAPKSPELAEKVTAQKMKMIISTLKVYYEYIILDLPAGFEDTHAEYFSLINRIYFVTQLQLSAISAAKRAINLIGILGKKESTCIVVNRQSASDIVSLHDLHSILNCRVILVIPSDYKTISGAANRGIPVVTAYPHSGVAKAFEDLAIYTKSKDKTLDVWDMSASEAARAYKALDSGTEKVKKEKGGLFLRSKH